MQRYALPPHIENLDPGILMSDNYMVLDVETTKLQFGDAAERANKLLLTCYKPGGRDKILFTREDEYGIERVLRMAEGSDLIVGHNVKMELKWLQRAGLDLHKVMPYCTMVAEHVIHGNTRPPLDLGSVANRYGAGSKEKFVDLLMKDKNIGTEDIPFEFLLDRCAKDVHQTEVVFLATRQRLAASGLLPTMYHRMLLCAMLADIEMRGMTLDPAKVIPRWEEVGDALRAVEVEINQMTGGVNPNSPKQLGEFLYDVLKFPERKDHRGKVMRTASGGRMTDKATVAALSAKTRKQAKFKELISRQAELDAEFSKALDKFKRCIDDESKLTFQFNQTVAKTHRLTSTGTKYAVQGQNMARAHKEFFKSSRDEWLIGEADGAQIEFRVAAYLGQDERATRDIRNGEDVHSFTAQVLTEAGQPTDRQGAKAHTFKPLFGGRSGTPAEVAYYTAFRNKYPGIDKAQQDWMAEVARHKRLVLQTGLTFYWPNARVDSRGYFNETTTVSNYPVQHLATGEIAPIAVVYMWHLLAARGCKAYIVNTVHDSGVIEMPEEEKDIVQAVSEESFTTRCYEFMDKVYGIKFNVPLGSGFKAGTHWSYGDEVKMQADPPYPPPGGY